jgi:hypothetical protein
MKRGIAVAVIGIVLSPMVVSCGDGSGTTTVIPPETPVTTGSPGPSPQLRVSPEFVQGAIPGTELVLLVSLAEGESGSVDLQAEVTGAQVAVEPATIAGSEVAEVTVVPDPVDEEIQLTVVVSTTRAGATGEVVRELTVVPWPDDREEQARQILVMFLQWLADNRPELGLGPDATFSGSFTAPLLLVVSHYTFYDEEWEIGLSWHVMVPPDDFSEIYLRPRDELKPTLAFRIDSWQTALETGEVEVTEVAPPAEVVR